MMSKAWVENFSQFSKSYLFKYMTPMLERAYSLTGSNSRAFKYYSMDSLSIFLAKKMSPYNFVAYDSFLFSIAAMSFSMDMISLALNKLVNFMAF